MPKVDFYVLDTADASARDEFLCRLVEKVCKQHRSIFIATEDAAQTAQLDELLWAFPPESFIPHATQQNDEQNAPVIIGDAQQAPHALEVYINLRQQPAMDHARQQRILEVVYQEPTALSASRKNYKFYETLGYQIESHKLSA